VEKSAAHGIFLFSRGFQLSLFNGGSSGSAKWPEGSGYIAIRDLGKRGKSLRQLPFEKRFS
jgi:hypothetical protein